MNVIINAYLIIKKINLQICFVAVLKYYKNQILNIIILYAYYRLLYILRISVKIMQKISTQIEKK